MATTIRTKAKHTVNYYYICQHCGKYSGMLSKEVAGTSQMTKMGYNARLSDRQSVRQYEKASNKMNDNVGKLAWKVNNGDYSDFDGICPHCHKCQNWSSGRFGRDVIGVTLAITLLVAFYGLFIPVILYTLMEAFISVKVAFTIYGVVVAIACVGAFALSLKIFIQKKRDVKGIQDNSVPEIDWNI